MDFQKQLKNIFDKHDPSKLVVSKDIQPVKEPPKRDWTIHKRSLPVGLDDPIVFNLTEQEAENWLARMKPKIVVDDGKHQRVVYYYAKVRDDGYLAGVYDNPKQIIKEEK